MDPARWHEIERLYHAALARPAEAREAFLAEACADDERLRHEVEALLDTPATADGFLASPALAVAAEMASHSKPVVLTGLRLGIYHLQERIGVGGMGEVYRARDPRLGRDVAIKVLPRAFATDHDRLSRFEREARVLAALNHPHIAAIYGFEEAEVSGPAEAGHSVRGLVLELVEGPTLADRLSAGPLARHEALTIALQIAEALEAAHAKGIIHRDLKPANIKVTSGGVVKVLDFGLAKVEAMDGGDLSHAPTITSMGTREGALVGTAAYMSPEQARGKAVDRRTDVWAFGCVLFEMLTGRSAFAGETLSDTIAQVLEREPDWQQLPRSTPARVRDLLRRCLHKDPEKRLSQLADARRDMEACLALPIRIPLLQWASQPLVQSILVVVAVVAAGLIVYELRNRDRPVPQLTKPVQVTSAIGVEDHPTWSPDDRTLAYESNETGNWNIWLAPVGGGPAVNRTADHSGNDRYPSWSPDGRQLAFWSDRDGGGYHVMPALGGTPTKVIATPGTGQFYHSAPDWSADGTQLAGVVYTIVGSRFEQSVEIVSIVTRESRSVSLPGTEEARLDLSWSPDGQYLAYVEAGQQQSEIAHLRVIRLSDEASFIITDTGANVRRPRWSRDGRYLLYVCNCVGPTDLWRQRTADGSAVGEPERVTSGLDVRDFAFSSDGSRLAYSKGRWVSNFWRVPILEDRPATWADAEQITFDQAYVEFLDVSPDGQQVAYSSDRTGNQDIWVMPIGGEPVQLTMDPAPDWGPGWSPDGRQLAFYSYRTGDREIFVMPATGGPATQLTRSPGLDAGSRWSPDGREIAFRSERTGNSEVWVISADGTESRQITNHPASDGLASWSPDGLWLAFGSNRSGRNQIWRVPSQGGEPELLTRGPGRGPHWSRDGAHIYFRGDEERAGNFWRFSFEDRSERPVTNLVGKRGTLGVMQPATDGQFLYFPWRDDLGDIWVMDVTP
jgi:eukaryotic-like serine/threonine-protein kinase